MGQLSTGHHGMWALVTSASDLNTLLYSTCTVQHIVAYDGLLAGSAMVCSEAWLLWYNSAVTPDIQINFFLLSLSLS